MGVSMNTETAPVLFLDFDGVTHPDPCGNASLFQSLPLIEAVLRRYPDVLVILSTTWRTTHPLDELKDLFSSDLAERVLSGTPLLSLYDLAWYPVPLSARPRQREIEAWLHQNRSLDHPWVAIDDRPWWFESECSNLLVTSRHTGFTESNVDSLDDMILRRCS
ncbi:MAG: hypothetical protein CVU36_23480 [Betaproteobacteria bacterium HGW-Betaproteobacteria-9]|nr:MAG: hypothetical protein CVU36_23480 [Betaproteobacteria bacterium HGW-Betaproteobacteria-9]